MQGMTTKPKTFTGDPFAAANCKNEASCNSNFKQDCSNWLNAERIIVDT
jgi:hypothetical protein